MEWECFWFVEFFFCLGVMGRAESKSFSGQPANRATVAPPSRRLSCRRLARRCESETPLRQAQGRPSRQPAKPALSEVEGMTALLRGCAFEMRFNFFQSLAFSLRQEPCRGNEIDDGTRGEAEEHRRVSVLAHCGQKHGCDGRRDCLIKNQSNAHPVRADASWHQFRKREPHANSRTDRIKCHKHEERNSDHPSILRQRDRRDER